jgi:hypothetical protein
LQPLFPHGNLYSTLEFQSCNFPVHLFDVLTDLNSGHHRKIRLIEGNAKCCNQKNLTVKGLFGRCLSEIANL